MTSLTRLGLGNPSGVSVVEKFMVIGVWRETTLYRHGPLPPHLFQLGMGPHTHRATNSRGTSPKIPTARLLYATNPRQAVCECQEEVMNRGLNYVPVNSALRPSRVPFPGGGCLGSVSQIMYNSDETALECSRQR